MEKVHGYTTRDTEARLKILIVTDAWHPQVNGVVRTYEYLEKELERMGHDVLVIGPGDFLFSLPMPGYSEIRLVLGASFSLPKKIRDFAPDYLHIATEGMLGIAARRYALDHNLKFSTCYHTHFPDYVAKRMERRLPFAADYCRKLAISFLRNFHSPATAMFVATESLKRELESWEFTAPVRTMTRGVDHSTFHPGEKTLFSDLPRPVALYVGRVAVEKNLEAFLDMPWDGSKVIVGTGPDMPMLHEKYPATIFMGPKAGKNLADCYRSADIFVFPSRTDTFGMVLVEAMACGLPVAGYPVTGPIDIITDKRLGCVDDDLETAALKALLQSEGQADFANAHARANYCWARAAGQFLEGAE